MSRSWSGKPLADHVAHFWSRVQTGAPDECWPWLGYRDDDGYGRYARWGHSPVGAHRHAYTLQRGEIPDGMLVCHRCDNPPCVNPRHLWLGTHADNHGDRTTKGRNSPRHGELNSRAKLSTAQVEDIRRLLADGVRQSEIARRFAVHASTVSLIKSGRRWCANA